MQLNKAIKPDPIFTHEGGRAVKINPVQQLRRSVLSCLLWEDNYYEDGVSIADRIKDEAQAVSASVLADLAIEARTKYNLRHVSLYLTTLLAQRAAGTSLVSDTIYCVIQRADELTEFLAIYAKVNGVTPDKLKSKLSNQVRKGLAQAFGQFDAYALGKYNRNKAIKLRDVLRLCHAKPRDEAQAAVWKKLLDDTLESPDTWEVALSGGADKKETWERLIREGKLGYLALLRNLRNMVQANVDPDLVRKAILDRRNGADRVLPFRFVAASRAAPMFEPQLDISLVDCIRKLPVLKGTTAVMVDVSQSMNKPLSMKSDLTRMDAAATLASMINAETLRVFTFSDGLKEVPPRHGMAGVDAIRHSQIHSGTFLFNAVADVQRLVPHDRLIIITDEQATGGPSPGLAFTATQTRMPDPVCAHPYLINVASARNGVGYGKWTHLDGFSEHVLRWIMEHESEQKPPSVIHYVPS